MASELVISDKPVTFGVFSVIKIATFPQDTSVTGEVPGSRWQRCILLMDLGRGSIVSNGSLRFYHLHEGPSDQCLLPFLPGDFPGIQKLQLGQLVQNKVSVSLIVFFILFRADQLVGTGCISQQAEVLQSRRHFC